jgi:hypothetical protein
MTVRRIAYLWGVLPFMVLGSAGAQTAEGKSQVAAEALFKEGRALIASGHVSEACPKFEASLHLDPALGTLLNLAECYEKLGKTASAWAEYRDAIPLARAAGSKVRLDLATRHAAELEARLSTLTIRVSSNAAGEAPQIMRDGVPVQPAELGSAIPVDPGLHTVEASAPGKKKWSSTVEARADSSKLVVEVPALDAAPGASPAATSAPSAAPEPAPPPAPAAHSGSGRRTAAIVVGAVGVVGLGLGTLFGLQAKSAWSEAKSHCTAYPYQCDSEAVDQRSSANSKATVSTVAFIAGGVALGVGAVLWLTAGPSKSDSVALGFGPGAAFVRGTFQ